MAYDKLVDSVQLDSDLTSVANAIRGKTGGSVMLAFPADFVSAINNIPSGGGGQYAMFGPNTEYLGRKVTDIVNLKDDTDFDSWTASTTYHTLKVAHSTNDMLLSIDGTNYVYAVVTTQYCSIKHLAGATLKATPIAHCCVCYSFCFPYPSLRSDLEGAYTMNMALSGQVYGIRYYNSTGTDSFSANQAYGVYSTGAPTISLNTAQIALKLGAINCRCNTSYFATARKPEIDSENTNMVRTVDVYRTPCNDSAMGWIVNNYRNTFINGYI